MVTSSIELEGPETQAAGARSETYRLLARGFRALDPAAGDELATGEYLDELRAALAGLPYPGEDLAPADEPAAEDIAAVYLALFDIGGDYGKPCFLYEGEHGGGRMKALDDVLRFYHYFGLRLDEDRRDRPDHLATELEFMHYLCFRETAAGGNDSAVGSLQRAQRDFLRLHLVPFTRDVALAIEPSGAPFYPALARCAADFSARELAYLESAR